MPKVFFLMICLACWSSTEQAGSGCIEDTLHHSISQRSLGIARILLQAWSWLLTGPFREPFLGTISKISRPENQLGPVTCTSREGVYKHDWNDWNSQESSSSYRGYKQFSRHPATHWMASRGQRSDVTQHITWSPCGTHTQASFGSSPCLS